MVIRSPSGSIDIEVTTGGVFCITTVLVVTHSDQISPSETLTSETQDSPFEVASGGTQFKSL